MCGCACVTVSQHTWEGHKDRHLRVCMSVTGCVTGGTAAVPEGKGCASGSSALSEHVGAYLSQATQGKDSVNTCRMQGEQEGEISDIGDSVQGARHCGGNAESRAWC